MMAENCMDNKCFELIYIIANNGQGSRILKYSKQYDIRGGTIFLGKGTVKSSILELLELNETRKEIILMAAEKPTAYKAMDELAKKFALKKPNHGIAFSTTITNILGVRDYRCAVNEESRGAENPMYNVIFAIVDKGKAESVIEAANKSGSKGGTIIKARGSGIHETSRVFSMEIEPEKEIVLIISESKLTDTIVTSIRERLEMDKPGNGVIFVQDVNKTYGLC